MLWKCVSFTLQHKSHGRSHLVHPPLTHVLSFTTPNLGLVDISQTWQLKDNWTCSVVFWRISPLSWEASSAGCREFPGIMTYGSSTHWCHMRVIEVRCKSLRSDGTHVKIIRVIRVGKHQEQTQSPVAFDFGHLILQPNIRGDNDCYQNWPNQGTVLMITFSHNAAHASDGTSPIKRPHIFSLGGRIKFSPEWPDGTPMISIQESDSYHLIWAGWIYKRSYCSDCSLYQSWS